MATTKTGYDLNRAVEYDEESQFDKGNRALQYTYLADILQAMDLQPVSYLELGCGTGYFSEMFLRKYPGLNALLVDASPEMIEVAVRRLDTGRQNIRFMAKYIQDMDWQEMRSGFDIVFSSYAIHHLNDDEKRAHYHYIFQSLRENGSFILIDIFRSEDEESNRLMEYLTCMDMQRRLREALQVDVEIEELKLENIIRKDRARRQLEGDMDSGLEWQLSCLKEIGFDHVTLFFVDTRHAGIIATKDKK